MAWALPLPCPSDGATVFKEGKHHYPCGSALLTGKASSRTITSAVRCSKCQRLSHHRTSVDCFYHLHVFPPGKVTFPPQHICESYRSQHLPSKKPTQLWEVDTIGAAPATCAAPRRSAHPSEAPAWAVYCSASKANILTALHQPPKACRLPPCLSRVTPWKWSKGQTLDTQEEKGGILGPSAMTSHIDLGVTSLRGTSC